MLGYVLMLVYSLLNLGESMIVKAYATRHKSGGMMMNAIIALFSALFFVITNTDGYYFPEGMLPLAVINAFLYAAGFYSMFLAYKVGPYGLTSLISRFSLLIPIFYGIVFLNEPANAFTYIGIATIFGAMVLMNVETKKNGEVEKSARISLKWLVYMLVTVLSNGFITILGRMQQIKYNDACTKEFQMISIGGSFLLLAIIGLINDKDKLGSVFKNGTLYGFGAGFLNGAKNFLSLLILLYLPISIVSPTKVGIGIILSFAVATVFYKEKYSLWQKIGVALGALAVVLLAL